MKIKTLCVVSSAVFCSCLLALSSASAADGRSISGWSIYNDTSRPLREVIAAAERARPTGLSREVPILVRPGVRGRVAPDGVGEDARLQGEYSRSAPGFAPSTIVSFPGLSASDNYAAVGYTVAPPDVNGDVGLDENGNTVYLQYVNLVWGVYDASGGLVPGGGPFAGNSFWAGFGGFCQNNNDGDPVALYDDNAGRWVVSQFSIGEGVQCVAVSTTSDPLGSYHRYAFTVTPRGRNDYPKLGVWADGTGNSLGQSAYTFTTRDFGLTGSFSVGAGVMERDKMLVGQPAQFFKASNPCVASDCVEGQLPPHLAGGPAPAGACPTFWTIVDGAYDYTPAGDGYRNHQLCVDWSNPASSTYSESPQVNAANFDRFLGDGFDDCIAPVLGGDPLDCLSLFTMYRAQYRWFGTHASVVLNTTVDVGDDRGGIRWAELRSSDGDSGWSLHQEGTWGPDDGVERWMGSIAMDQDGNIALGYTAAGASLRPAVRYTARAAGDPLGTMGAEASCVEGTGSQLATNGRWGDYSAMGVDPRDDCTFWYTQEYQEATGSFNWNTRICSFKFADCGGSCVPEPEVCDSVDNDCDGEIDEGCPSSPICGDGICEYPDETCDADCLTTGVAVCGDGVCDVNLGEDCSSCAADCAGKTNGRPSGRFCCGADVGCEEALCSSGGLLCSDSGSGSDIVCGDNVCDRPFEDEVQCDWDCDPCAATETSCSDFIDNDCDGFVDGQDPDCGGGSCPDVGDACTIDSDCCSNKCRGPRGGKTCKAL